ncbi:MAG: metallophosphoesterase [Planctomycetes bacterium]|nr:metallophosphoesterase [Planctomycetota bacterium]
MRSLLLVACALCCAPLLAQKGEIHTDRPAPRLLPLPKQDDCFFFLIYGDRTSGVPAGLKVLKQAVQDTNLLGPDLVMTVGDLVQGYNQPAQWLEQMREFKAIMKRLDMPWFPVAGNHDVYTRDEKRRITNGNAAHYEKHFGPLWYWFAHKRCAFVVLYSDEGEAGSGLAGFKEPKYQRMSKEQLTWLEGALAANKQAEHVFLFLHHPRWRKGGYGDDWDRVHQKLVAAGNVSAVFAGHIHQMVYGGKRDGIEYFALAATGANLADHLPERAGFLHHFNLVTVRKSGIQVSTIPVGTVLDPKQLTEQVNADVRALDTALNAARAKPLAVGDGGAVDGLYTVEFENPTTRPIELTLIPDGPDPRWSFRPDHQHSTIPPHESRKITFSVTRPASDFDAWFAAPRLRVQCDYLADGLRISMREKTPGLALTPPKLTAGASPGFVQLGKRGHLETDTAGLALRGACTVETFVLGRELTGARALIACRAFGLRLIDGKPEFHVTLRGLPRGRARRVAGTQTPLSPRDWHHLAGVFDGQTARLFVDGRLVATARAQGELAGPGPKLWIGAGPVRRGLGEFGGVALDELRISASARYAVETFELPNRLHGAKDDANTRTLLHFNRKFGPWVANAAARGTGTPRCVGALEIARERIQR